MTANMPNFRIACLMMQKNEDELLAPWVRYHAALFGIENLYVFDNGSTSRATLNQLRSLETDGLKVDWDHDTPQHFSAKGEIVSSAIRAMDRDDPYDFYFPLDCDEFVAVADSVGNVRFSSDAIAEALAPYESDGRVLAIGAAYDNNPSRQGHFRVQTSQRKCFFARGACKSLDLGFHDGESILGQERVLTSIVYFHFHYRPYDEYRKYALQKLSNRIADFSREGLERHLERGGDGHHLVGPLLMSREQFEAAHDFPRSIPVPGFQQRLSELNIPVLFGEIKGQQSPEPSRPSYVGSVDAVELDGIVCKISGWAASRTGQPASAFRVRLGSTNIDALSTTRVERPDVNSVVRGTAADCGFELAFSILQAPIDENDLNIFVIDGSGTNVQSLPYSSAKRWSPDRAAEALARFRNARR